MDYNLAAIPTDLAPTRPKEMFDRNYMNQLFELGYEMASQGYPWMKYPPGFDPNPVFKKPVKIGASPGEKLPSGAGAEARPTSMMSN
jgi:hypothetical protein